MARVKNILKKYYNPGNSVSSSSDFGINLFILEKSSRSFKTFELEVLGAAGVGAGEN